MKTSAYQDVFTESILKICNVGLKDSGNYLCTASSGIVSVSASKTTNLRVLNNQGIIIIASSITIMEK